MTWQPRDGNGSIPLLPVSTSARSNLAAHSHTSHTPIAFTPSQIQAAQWLPWEALHAEWVAAGKPVKEKNMPLTHSSLPEGKRLVSRNILKWLDQMKAGKGMPCKLDGCEVKIGV